MNGVILTIMGLEVVLMVTMRLWGEMGEADRSWLFPFE